jgi:two-component system, OmpR family, sensor kinase
MRAVSLRTRLVAVAVALVAAAVAATGVATYVALRSFLYDRFDEQLLADAARVARAVSAAGRAPLYVDPPDAIRVVSGGEVGPVFTDPNHILSLTPIDVDRVLSADTPLTVTTTDGRERRVVAVPLEPRIGGVVVVGEPTSELNRTLGKLLGLEAIAAIVAVGGTAVLGTWGVRLGLRPLDRVTETARTVAAELGPDGTGLDRRVPADDPDTEVGQLAQAVNTMLDAMEREYLARYESEQRMRRFLADASHELRTPLTSLRGYAELVRLRGGLDEHAGDSLHRIEAEGTRMSRLVDDLLTLARHDRGIVPDRGPVDLAEVIDDAVAGLHAAYPERTITTRAAGPTVVLGDRDQLVQIVGNVLTNAAEHTRPDGPISVDVSEVDGTARVSVTDAGPGLRPDQAAQVFDRFWRADAARTRARGGSGLGLSIVQALVAGHGGQVRFESDPREGSTVTIELPSTAAEGSPQPAADSAPG